MTSLARGSIPQLAPRVRRALAAVALVVAFDNLAHAQSRWIPNDLGTLGGSFSSATAINDAGLIVGQSERADGVIFPAFLWTSTGGMVDLGTPPAGLQFASAKAVNSAGQVVGILAGMNVPSDAFLWTDSQPAMIRLFPCMVSCQAWGINDAGQVVGGLLTSAGWRGFVWTRAAGPTLIGAAGGSLTSANDINNAGVIVGQGLNGQAVLWTANGGVIDLGTLGGTLSTANAINDLDQAVGQSTTASGRRHAFLWTRTAGMRDLGTLGGDASEALGINVNGQVVGWSETSPGGPSHAFVWSEADGMVDLGVLAGMNSVARGINAAGEIVGDSDVTGSPQRHAVRWRVASAMTGVTLTTSVSSPQVPGTTVTLMAEGRGGLSPYTYRFWVQAWGGGEWVAVRDWSANATCQWTPSQTGGYNLAVEARSSAASTAEVQSSINFVVSANGAGPMTHVLLVHSPESPLIAGTTITLRAIQSSGGTMPYTYRFWIQPSGAAWQLVQDWDASPTYAWMPTSSGDYNLAVEARSSGATVVEVRDTHVITIAPSGGGIGLTAVTLSTNIPSPQSVGSTIELRAASTGGALPTAYRFWVQPWGGQWVIVRDWNTVTSYQWQPTIAHGYNLAVEARSSGATAIEARAYATFLIASAQGAYPVDRVYLQALPQSPQPAGRRIQLRALAIGGSGPISYRFWIQPWGGTWQIGRDWDGSATFEWLPVTPGGYNLAVEARTSGATSVEAQTALSFYVTAP